MTWTPGYDISALKRERGLLCVREAADSWARQGRGSIEDHVFVAVLIRLLMSPETYRTLPVEHGSIAGDAVPDLPSRPLEEWRGLVDTPIEELRRQSVPDSRAGRIVEDLRRRVAEAADQWSLGDPEKPETETVFRELARILEAHGVLGWWGEATGAKP